jgi:hypothetical protein
MVVGGPRMLATFYVGANGGEGQSIRANPDISSEEKRNRVRDPVKQGCNETTNRRLRWHSL